MIRMAKLRSTSKCLTATSTLGRWKRPNTSTHGIAWVFMRRKTHRFVRSTKACERIAIKVLSGRQRSSTLLTFLGMERRSSSSFMKTSWMIAGIRKKSAKPFDREKFILFSHTVDARCPKLWRLQFSGRLASSSVRLSAGRFIKILPPKGSWSLSLSGGSRIIWLEGCTILKISSTFVFRSTRYASNKP